MKLCVYILWFGDTTRKQNFEYLAMKCRAPNLAQSGDMTLPKRSAYCTAVLCCDKLHPANDCGNDDDDGGGDDDQGLF